MNQTILETINVNNDHVNERLDKFLVNSLNQKRSYIQTLIENNQVYINDKLPSKNGQLLKLNDEIKIVALEKQEVKNIESFKLDLDIKYEDNDLIIVNKPSGLLTHMTQYNENETLINALKTYSKNQWEPLLVHRLDKDTSGLIIVAKNKQAQDLLLTMFQSRAVIKKYYALVHGNITKKHFYIDVPIGRSNDNKLKMIAGEGKNLKNAISEINVLKTFDNYSLIEVILHTGRTHQIRVHTKYINHPIVNDPLYSNFKANSDYGQYLMAYYLEFIHPISKQKITIQIDLDPMFEKFINQL